MIGGRVYDKATGTFTGSITPGSISLLGTTGTVSCKSDIRQDFGGFQLG